MSAKINISLASFPGQHFLQACESAYAGVSDPFYGGLSFDNVQLVPQSRGHLTVDVAKELITKYPNTAFRLHANVRLAYKNSLNLKITDLSNYRDHVDWFKEAAKVSQALDAKVYTLHSGYAKNASMQDIISNCKEIEDLFQCKVGIEGQYPSFREKLLVHDWSEYKQIMDSGCYFVVDLSHLNILAKQLGENYSLAKDLVSHPNCIEVHLSANNGKADTHSHVSKAEWWHPLLDHVSTGCDIFYEGNLLRMTELDMAELNKL